LKWNPQFHQLYVPMPLKDLKSLRRHLAERWILGWILSYLKLVSLTLALLESLNLNELPNDQLAVRHEDLKLPPKVQWQNDYRPRPAERRRILLFLRKGELLEIPTKLGLLR